MYTFIFRYLNGFLEEFNRILSTKLECAKKNGRENQKYFDQMSNALYNLEKTRKEVKLKQILTN